MRRKGLRGYCPIKRYETCQRELNLQIALKPLWRKACVISNFLSVLIPFQEKGHSEPVIGPPIEISLEIEWRIR